MTQEAPTLEQNSPRMRIAAIATEGSKYLLASAAAFICDYCLLIALTEVAGLHYLLSAAIGFSVGLVLNYALSVTLVFDTRRLSDPRLEFAIFFAIGLIGLLLNEAFIKLFVDVLSMRYALAKIPVACITLLFNFTARRVLLFSRGANLIFAIERFSACVGITALWYLCRPYTGIIHDSRIYVRRALADLHPQDIGRELAFVHDGQSQFSLFPRLMSVGVRLMGPADAAMVLTAIGLALWFSAAAYLLSRILRGRLFWAALLCLCAMPAGYGAFHIFHWAEPFATPRIFAEAASLAALGLFLERKLIAMSCLLGVAILLHPIMALAATGVIVVCLCLEDRRWMFAAGTVAAAAIGASVIKVPLFDRLLVPPDPAWARVIGEVTPHLYLTKWLSPDFAILGCQLGTAVLLLLSLDSRPVRRLVTASILVAAAGVLVTAICPTLLILQAQLWRAQWLVSFFVAGLFPVIAHALWKRSVGGRAALASLLIAWTQLDWPIVVLPAISVAFGLLLIERRYPLPRYIAIGCWSLAAVLVPGFVAVDIYGTWQFLGPEPLHVLPKLISCGVQTPIVVGAALAIALSPIGRRREWLSFGGGCAALLVAVLASANWDARLEYERRREAGADISNLKRLVKSGQTVWLGAHNSWLWSTRPSWWDALQGSGVVFDRSLAIEWDRRYRVLLAAHMIPEILSPSAVHNLPDSMPLISRPDLELLCARGGPDWLIVPREQIEPIAAMRAAGTWRAPEKIYGLNPRETRWIGIRDYVVFDCAKFSSSKSRSPGQPA